MAGNPRPPIVGPTNGPESSYPLQMEGNVIHGFGRGSQELGIPTANLPIDDSLPWITHVECGVYFGWASLRLPKHPDKSTTPSGFNLYPMVMSIGYNPHYGNTTRSVEVHVLHEFEEDFYGAEMRLLILGFIREEKCYEKVNDLIEDIKMDCDVARRSLARKAWCLRETGKGTLDGSWLVRKTEDRRAR